MRGDRRSVDHVTIAAISENESCFAVADGTSVMIHFLK